MVKINVAMELSWSQTDLKMKFKKISLDLAYR